MVQRYDAKRLKELLSNQVDQYSLPSIDEIERAELLFINNYISFIENHPDIVLVFTLEGELLTENLEPIIEKLGLPIHAISDFRDIIPQKQFQALLASFNDVRKGKKQRVQKHFTLQNHEAEQLYFIATFIPIKSLHEEIIAISVVLQDISEKVRLEMALEQTNEEYKYIFDHIQSGTWLYDVKKEEINFASKGLANILQLPLDKLYAEPNFLEQVILPEYREQFRDKNHLLFEGIPVERTYQVTTGKNTLKWIHEQTIPTVDHNGEVTHFFGRIIDITKEMEMKRKLEYLAKYDSITDLPNYHFLHDKLDEYITDESIEQFAILSINLDNFLWINDLLGYQTSDLVLKMIAERMRNLCPEKGFLARESSDSFIFLIPNYANEDELVSFVEEMMERISQKLKIEKYEFYITTSIGISFYPKHGEDKLTLLEHAHSALHYAKKIGKNNYQIFSSDRDISAHRKYMLEKDLRKALENDEFEIFFQPQVDAKTNELVGAEALIRWNHPEWGRVSPGEFIPIAEKNHLIGEIEDWMVLNVCKQLDIWRKEGKPLIPIAINISPIHLLNPGIVDTIKAALDTYQIPAQYIIFEITEGALLQKEDYILDTLKKIKHLGIKFALDDFGTGYSTFQYLQTFDLDILKIDRSFIQNLFMRNKSYATELAIVSAFLHFAKSTGLEVVAEGVEEHEQLKFLAQKNCDKIQGYLFSKPIPVDEFERVLQQKYLEPIDAKQSEKPVKERRQYSRFTFKYPIPAKVYVTKIGDKKVSVGYAKGLIENISAGGIRFISQLRLPVKSQLNFKFEFEIIKEKFYLDGALVYKNEEKDNILAYGVRFEISDEERKRIENVINQLTVLTKLDIPIPDTEFVMEEPATYLAKNYKPRVK